LSAESSAPKEKKLIQQIKIVEARERNLKGISLEIPINSLTVVCGPSGSGKSALAVETLGKSALVKMELLDELSGLSETKSNTTPPKVNYVDNVQPVIAYTALPQHSRDITVAEILGLKKDLAELASNSTIPCPRCSAEHLQRCSKVEEIIERLIALHPSRACSLAIPLLEPPITSEITTKELLNLLDQQGLSGVSRLIIDNQEIDLDQLEQYTSLGIDNKQILVVLDRFSLVSNRLTPILKALDSVKRSHKKFHICIEKLNLLVGDLPDLVCPACGFVESIDDRMDAGLSENFVKLLTQPLSCNLEQIRTLNSGDEIIILLERLNLLEISLGQVFEELSESTRRSLYFFHILRKPPKQRLIVMEQNVAGNLERINSEVSFFVKTLLSFNNTLVVCSSKTPSVKFGAQLVCLKDGVLSEALENKNTKDRKINNYKRLASIPELYSYLEKEPSPEVCLAYFNSSELEQRKAFEKLSEIYSGNRVVLRPNLELHPTDFSRSLAYLMAFRRHLAHIFAALPLAKQYGFKISDFLDSHTTEMASPLRGILLKNYSFNELLSLPAFELLEILRNFPKCAQALKQLQNFQLDHISLNLPLWNLSQGEQQRYCLARFFFKAQKGSLCLLKDPFSCLDLDQTNALITSLDRESYKKQIACIIFN